MNASRKIVIALAMLASPIASLAFQCKTDYGQIEIPDLPGYVTAETSVVQEIQRQKDATSSGGRLLFVLTFIGAKEDCASRVSMSHYALLTDELTAVDFEDVYEEFSENLSPLMGQTVNGIKYLALKKRYGYFYFTGQMVGRDEHGNRATSLQLVGLIKLRNHAFSFVAHTGFDNLSDMGKFESKITKWLDCVVRINEETANGNISLISHETLARLLGSPYAKAIMPGFGTKAFGLGFEFAYPKSMVASPLGQGHTVLKFNEKIDGLDFTISASVFPADDATRNCFAELKRADGEQRQNLARQFAAEIARSYGASSMACGARELDGKISIWSVTHQKITRGAVKMNMVMLTYHILGSHNAALALNFILSAKNEQGGIPPDPSLPEIQTLQPVIDECLDRFSFY